jgi:hypothetical protein
MRSYAMVIVQGDGTYRPDYIYTWSQAQAAGAQGGQASGPVPSPPRVSTRAGLLTIVRVRVRRHSLSARIVVAPTTDVSCSLTRRRTGPDARYRRCGHAPVFRRLRRGVYMLRVRAGREFAAREVRIG